MRLTPMTRFRFLKSGLAVLTGSLFPLHSMWAQEKQEVPPQLKPEHVREFVRVCHNNFPVVKEMLENNHLLLHCSWDLGGGDFESGIEAAGHVGNREIADYLLSQGARYNMFLAAMYGNLEMVKSVLKAEPKLLNAKGPHGLTLLHHANKGGEQATPVAEFLKGLGATATKINFYEKG